jgi:serine/threonine-protein kinase HipA
MTLLEAQDGDAHDYSEIAETLSDVGAVTTEDLRELWRRVAFSVLINNTDDHLRNHGFSVLICHMFGNCPNADPGQARRLRRAEAWRPPGTTAGYEVAAAGRGSVLMSRPPQ